MSASPDPESVRRILLIRIGKIGDLIVSNFAFRRIRSAFPRAEIMLVTLPRNRELLRHNRTFDRVRYFRKGLDLPPLLIQTRCFRPDLYLDFNDSPSRTSDLLARFSTAPVKVGFTFPGRRTFLTHPVDCPAKESSHITDRLRLIPEEIGLRSTPDEAVPSLDLGESESAEVKRRLDPIRADGGSIIAVNLSAGDPSRYWQPGKWRDLLTRIAAESPHTCFILLTAPGETRLGTELARALPLAQTIAPGMLDFHRFASYIAGADLLISPDTSAIHVAAAFQTPVLGLYPAIEWNFRSWQPIGTRFISIRPTTGDVGGIDVDPVFDGYLSLNVPSERA